MAIVLRVLRSSVRIAEPERDHVQGFLEDRDRGRAGFTNGSYSGSGAALSIPESRSTSTRDHERVERPAAGSSLDKWGGRESAVHYQVVQQAISHSPDHERLFRMDSQLVLNAVDSVPDGHGLVAPRLGDLGV